MNIRIDDDVPLPQPDKPDTWVKATQSVEASVNKVKSALEGWQSAIRSFDNVTEVGEASGWTTGVVVKTEFEEPVMVDPPTCPVCDFGHYFGHCSQCGHTDKPKLDNVVKYEGRKTIPVEQPKRYPAETTYDAKGVPTVDCFLVGGPLNGKNGPIVGTAQVVELDIYAADGSISSIELYELGDRKELGCRYYKGSKVP